MKSYITHIQLSIINEYDSCVMLDKNKEQNKNIWTILQFIQTFFNLAFRPGLDSSWWVTHSVVKPTDNVGNETDKVSISSN